MKRYRLITTALLIVFLTGSSLSYIKKFRVQSDTRKLEICKIVLPHAENFLKEEAEPPYYKAYAINSNTGKKELIGFAFLTGDIVPKIQGYAGQINIMVGMDTKGSIVGTHLISHSETPSYVGRLDEYVKQFIGLDTKSAFKLGQDIDAISQATITGQAITQAIDKSLNAVAVSALGIGAVKDSARIKKLPLDQIVILPILFLMAVVGIFLKNRKLQWIILCGGLIYLGIIKATMFSVIQIANIGLLKFPLFGDSPVTYILIGFTLITLFAFGNIYCGNICPFATLQEILYNAFKRLRPDETKPSDVFDQKARHGKYIVLFIALIASFMAGTSDVAIFEPYILLFTANATKLGWIFVFLLLIISIFNFRFWCKYLCPVGAFNGLMSTFSIFKIKPGKDCSDCDTCIKICPTDAIKRDTSKDLAIDYPECILCGKCLRSCPKDTLKYRVS